MLTLPLPAHARQLSARRLPVPSHFLHFVSATAIYNTSTWSTPEISNVEVPIVTRRASGAPFAR